MSVAQHNNGARRPFRHQVVEANNYGTHTCTGDVTLTELTAQHLSIDPGGASRNVTLPKVENGLSFTLVNTADAFEVLTVKNASGSTIGTVGQGETAEFWSDGSSWVMQRRWGTLASGQSAVLVATGTIAAAQVAALNATPQTLIPAPGAGKYIQVHRCHWFLDFNSAAYNAAAAGDTLNLKYTNGSGAAVVDAVAGDAIGAAAADYHTLVLAVPEVIPVANAAIVAHVATGEWGVGDSPLKYRIEYSVRDQLT